MAEKTDEEIAKEQNDAYDAAGEMETVELTNEKPAIGYIHINVTADGSLQLDAQNVSAPTLWAASKMLDFHAGQGYAQYLMDLERQKLQLVRGTLSDHLGPGGLKRN